MSQRTEQVQAQLHRILGDILAKDVEFPLDTLVSIMRVEVTPDLKKADVHISVLPYDNRGQVSNVLKKDHRHIQQTLNRQLSMKFSPKLSFYIDDTQEFVSSIEKFMDDPLS